ncbi:MAG: adenylate kinase [Gaiellaceae bacterium]
MALDIVILGPPGAGKGTQAKLIAREAAIPHVNTGDLLRAEKAAETELGLRVRATMDRGDLVPDDLVIGLLRDRLAREDTAEGFVLEGYPRNLAQAEALDRMLDEIERGELSIVLHFPVSDELAEQRLLGRAREEGRSDDTPDVIRHRIEVQRVPDELIAYYRAKGILVGIHADRSIDEVFAEVQNVLQAATAR